MLGGQEAGWPLQALHLILYETRITVPALPASHSLWDSKQIMKGLLCNYKKPCGYKGCQKFGAYMSLKIAFCCSLTP